MIQGISDGILRMPNKFSNDNTFKKYGTGKNNFKKTEGERDRLGKTYTR